MRTITIGLCGICTLLLFARVTDGQMAIRQAPTDKAAFFTLANIESESRAIQTKQPSTVRLLEGGEAFSVNILHRAGAEPATVHGNLADLYVVREGSGTLETGGSLVDPRPAGRQGDLTGSSIRGGTTQIVEPGDVVFIPPGVAHRFTESNVTYLNIHFPTKK
jgi:mannose-6-phosphate isomerase-like protein (cupin superfamily)